MDNFLNLDLMQLAKKAIELHPKDSTPQLSSLSKYVTISTEGVSLTDPTVDLDVNKVKFVGEGLDSISFADKDSEVYSYKTLEFGTRWILLEESGVLGSLVSQSYDDLLKALAGQLPHHLKNKIK